MHAWKLHQHHALLPGIHGQHHILEHRRSIHDHKNVIDEMLVSASVTRYVAPEISKYELKHYRADLKMLASCVAQLNPCTLAFKKNRRRTAGGGGRRFRARPSPELLVFVLFSLSLGLARGEDGVDTEEHVAPVLGHHLHCPLLKRWSKATLGDATMTWKEGRRPRGPDATVRPWTLQLPLLVANSE